MNNRLSQVAFRLYAAGMTGNETEVPERLRIFSEVFDVPEKPEGWEFKPKDPSETIIVPVSGGLDSTLCYLMAKATGKKVLPMYFDIGQPYAEKEKEALKELMIQAIVVKLNVPDDIKAGKFATSWQHIIPARNFLFLSTAAEFVNSAGTLYFGALDGEIKDRLGGDKSRKFVDMLRTELRNLPFPVELVLPLEKYDKPQAIEHAVKNMNIPIEYLVRTLSCFDGKGQGHCGKCQACLRRFIAFYANGVDLREDENYGFASDIMAETIQYQGKYITLMGAALKNKDFSQYSEQRCKATLDVFEKLGIYSTNNQMYA